MLGLEIIGLTVTAVAIIMVMLGYFATWFSGTRFFLNLLPFAAFILVLIVVTAGLLLGWWRLRQYVGRWWAPLPSMIAVLLAAGACTMLMVQFHHAFNSYRNLVGGREEARRIALAHQVYAAYRRQDQIQLQKMIERARPYEPFVQEAARAFDVDPDLLMGVAAAESSFLPRKSKDGGQGLFQITQIPKDVVSQVKQVMGIEKITLSDPRQNAFVAAAELQYYLNDMDGNLFLGLLAFNIGPANGGLHFIMERYGVTNFVTIQPYLQKLPRDYPIRVLAYSLAFRLWRQTGRLLAYENGKNARIIQRIGIPGLRLND